MNLSDARRARIMDLTWHVVTVKAGRETCVGLMLQRLGYTAFVPTVWQRRRRVHKHDKYGLKSVEVTRPLAPRYVLIGFGAEPQWPVVLGYPYILGTVGINGRPSMLPGRVVTQVLAMHVGESLVPVGQQERPAQAAALRIGRVARVLRGALAGELVTVENLRGRRAGVVPQTGDSTVAVNVGFDNLEMVE